MQRINTILPKPDSAQFEHTADARQLVNWLPVEALISEGKPYVRWMEMRGVELAEPFFLQTVSRLRQELPPRSETVTGLEALIELEEIADSVQPSGFIFHGSRCGSTLLANVCRTLDGAIVISEAPIIEKLVSRFFTYAAADRAKTLFNLVLLRAALHALGQRRGENEQKLYVKFSALSVLQFGQVKRLWPQVPCIFMFRDPVDVITSNVNNVPEWMQFESVPEQASAVTGLPTAEALRLDHEERCARALGRFYDAGAKLGAAGAFLLDYADVSLETLIAAVEFLGVTPTEIEAPHISQVAKLYSKDSTLRRRFDPEGVRGPATARVSDVANRWAMAPYQHLKQMAGI